MSPLSGRGWRLEENRAYFFFFPDAGLRQILMKTLILYLTVVYKNKGENRLNCYLYVI